MFSSFSEINKPKNAIVDAIKEKESASIKTPDTPSVRRDPTILCLLDYILGNLTIHYSRTRVIHARQGFDDILEVVREENLLANGIKLIYLLIGRADCFAHPGSVIRSAEKLLDGLTRINPRIMIVIGGIISDPADSTNVRTNAVDINQKLAKLAENDHHWVFFNPNISISVAGEPQKRFFDKEGKVNKAGCRFIAQALVATSRSARMLQNYDLIPLK